jgi:hypothetical protein
MLSPMPAESDLIGAFREEFKALRSLAERAAAQLDDERLFAQLDADANSVALLMKHVGGNLRSRWTDVLTTNGEKPDRQRDREFEREPSDTRAVIEGRWSSGWAALMDALDALRPDDLSREVVIGTRSFPLARALARSLAHTAGHVHQIVLLARHWQGPAWQTLSVPRGQSDRLR